MENYHILKVEPIGEFLEEDILIEDCSVNLLINYAYKFKSENFIKKICSIKCITEKNLAILIKAVIWEKDELLCISKKSGLVLYNYFIRYGDIIFINDDFIFYCMKYLPVELENVFLLSIRSHGDISNKIIENLTYEEICKLVKYNMNFSGYEYEKVKYGNMILKDIDIFNFYHKYEKSLFVLKNNCANNLMKFILTSLSSYEGMEINYANFNSNNAKNKIILKFPSTHRNIKNYAKIINFLLRENKIDENLINEANIILNKEFKLPNYLLYENYIDGFATEDFLFSLFPYTLRKEREFIYALKNYNLNRDVLHEIAYLNIQYRQTILDYLSRDDKTYEQYKFNIIKKNCKPLISLKDKSDSVKKFYAKINNLTHKNEVEEKNYSKKIIPHKNNLIDENIKKIKTDLNLPTITYELIKDDFTNIYNLYDIIKDEKCFNKFIAILEHVTTKNSIGKILKQFIADGQKIYYAEKKYPDLYLYLAQHSKINLSDIPSEIVQSTLKYFSNDEIFNFNFNFFIEKFYGEFFNDFQFTDTNYLNKFYCDDNCKIELDKNYANILKDGPTKKAYMLNKYIYAKNYTFDLHKNFFNRSCINHELILILGKFSIEQCIKYLEEFDFNSQSFIILNKLEYLYFNKPFKINNELKLLSDRLNEYHFIETEFNIALLKNRCESIGNHILKHRKYSKKIFIEAIEYFEKTGHILFKKNILKYFNFYVREFHFTNFEFLYLAVILFNEKNMQLKSKIIEILKLFENREQIEDYIKKWKNSGKKDFAEEIMQILK